MKSKQYILVTGGAGYIGSHMARLLLDEGYPVVVFDNLSTGYKSLVAKDAAFIKGDLHDTAALNKVFTKYHIGAVMHFAASIEVGESVRNPLKYYENNVGSAINLLKAMHEHKVKKFIFSSTAAVYGEPKHIPILEDNPAVPNNPYGRTKLMIENILSDLANAHDLNYIALRYFNVAGAHECGTIGEMHNPESHLIPNVLKAIKGSRKEFTLFGDDYPTPDGTCVRDYIHVVDLCAAHLLALKALDKDIKNQAFNLGNGNGYSVKEVIAAAQEVAGKNVKVKICPRRPGDSAKLVASSQKAKDVLGWQPQFGLNEMVSSAWAWESR